MMVSLLVTAGNEVAPGIIDSVLNVPAAKFDEIFKLDLESV